MYKRLQDIQSDLNTLRTKGRVKGANIGWDYDILPYTVTLGSTTYMAAAPASGKTELIKEFQINLSCLHGWNHVILTPETGSVADIYSELCHSYIGKPYIKGNNSMTDAEITQAEYFINEHFIVIDIGEEDLKYKDFYKLVDTIESDIGKKIHTTLIDPWNELSEDYLPQDLGREDKYLSRVLGEVRKNARKNNRHNFILTHVRDQKIVNVADISYFPPPHAREFAGGQVWFRKGNSILIPWRPPLGLSGSDNIAYEPNELHLKIAKTKPKGTSRNGTYKLYLDIQQYKYYMLVDGKRVYANRGKHEPKKEVVKSAMQPNLDFEKPKPKVEPNKFIEPKTIKNDWAQDGEDWDI